MNHSVERKTTRRLAQYFCI